MEKLSDFCKRLTPTVVTCKKPTLFLLLNVLDMIVLLTHTNTN